MRILIICHHPKNWLAGAASVCLNTAEQLRLLGHQVDELNLDELSVMRRVRDPRLRQLIFPYAICRERPDRLSGYDLIDASSASGWLLFRLLGRRPHRPALVMRSMGLEHLDDVELELEARRGHEKLSWKYRLIHRRLRLNEVMLAIKASDAMISLVRADREYVVARRWKDASLVHVTGAGVGEDFFEIRPKRSRAADEDFWLLWWGSWIGRKGTRYFLPAIDRVRQQVPKLRVTLGATGRDRDGLAKDVPGDHQFHVLGPVSREEQHRILAQHDCLAFPSLSGGFGVAALEAMAASIPVVATPTGIGSDVIDPAVNGLIVAKRDSTGLANALTTLANEPELARRLGSAAREAARDYTWPRVTARTVGAYESALARAHGGEAATLRGVAQTP